MEMHKIKTMRAWLTLGLCSLWLGLPLAQAHAEKQLAAGSKASQAIGEAYLWFDGEQPRTTYLAPQLVADFRGELANTIRSSATQAVAQPQYGPTIISLDDGAQRRALSVPGTSPVFYDQPSGGRIRALPGNVVVEFDDGVDQSQAERWAEDEGVALLRKFGFGNYYLVESPAGIEALNLANKLRDTASVKSAQPNWWTEVVAK
jgi:hypothetical protein